MNHVFIIGHVNYQKEEMKEPFRHFFSAVATLEGGKISISSGLDFGALHGLDIEGTLRDKRATEAIFMPISDDSFDRFNTLVSDMRWLNDNHELPFYYEHESMANIYMEDPKHDALDLEGNTIPSDSLQFQNKMPKDAFGHEIDPMQGYSIYKDMTYVRGNCGGMLNFMAKRSGIDLAQLDDNWWNVRNGKEMSDMIASVFSDGRFKMPGTQDFCFQTHETSSGQVAWKVGHENKDGIKMEKMIDIAAAAKGGHEKMFDFFQGLKPFECAPAPIPQYLQDRLDDIPNETHNVPSFQ